MYSGLQSTATAMLKNFGTTATLIKAVPSSFDPATGSDDTAQVHTCEVFAVFVKPRVSFGTIRGEASFAHAIQQGDSIAIVAPKGGTFVSPPAHYFPGQEVIPEQNDVIDGWTILDVEEVNPAGTVVLYKCHVRKQ
jgi:hypothetical protein